MFRGVVRGALAGTAWGGGFADHAHDNKTFSYVLTKKKKKDTSARTTEMEELDLLRVW